MKLIEFKKKLYPLMTASGNGARFAIPYAKEVCRGVGFDVGCGKEEWAFPGAMPIDIMFKDRWHALNLPIKQYGNPDYIFSSHMLEHIVKWVHVLNYWTSCLKVGGILFLYLPHYDQEYWRPWNNPKHHSVLTVEMLRDYMESVGYINIFSSGRDLNYSFMIMGEKSDASLF